MFSASFLLLIPPGLAGLSAVYLSVKLSTSIRHRSFIANGALKHNASQDDSLPTSPSQRKDIALLRSIKDFDGSSIFFYRVLRFLVVAALLGLQVSNIVLKTDDLAACLQLVFIVSIASLYYPPALTNFVFARFMHQSYVYSLF